MAGRQNWVGRSPRLSILRRAEFSFEGQGLIVRLRNISESGTMIELPRYIMPGTAGTLAIQDGPRVEVRVVWWADGRCGLTFAETVDLAWLAASPNQTVLQRSA